MIETVTVSKDNVKMLVGLKELLGNIDFDDTFDYISQEDIKSLMDKQGVVFSYNIPENRIEIENTGKK